VTPDLAAGGFSGVKLPEAGAVACTVSRTSNAERCPAGEVCALNNGDRLLGAFLLAYAASSLFHHIHNAEFLSDYPNMPAWLSRGGVYAAWCSVTAVGMIGLVLLWNRRRLPGLCLLGAYAAAGLYGLAHYFIAPMSAYTAIANISIWLEVVTALALLVLVVTSSCRAVRDGLRRSTTHD